MRFPYHGAGVGLVKDGCLLIGKRCSKPFYGLWSVPGGEREKGIDRDELATAKRELFEETGIDLNVLEARIVCSWSLRIPFFSWTTFYYEIKELKQELRPAEFSDLEWVKFEDVKKKHLRPFTVAEVRKLIRNL